MSLSPTTNRSRALAAVVVMALVAIACGSVASNEPVSTSTTATSPTTEEPSAVNDPTTTSSSNAPAVAAVGTLPEGPSALSTYTADEFPAPLIDPSGIISGGPPPDGIPPIDNPAFIAVLDNLDLLPANEPVVALEIDGDARAYPARIMIWHEIVNDTVGGVPVSVTYCPLCNSAATYVREINGVETTFGTSGRLFASALVMYDRATETLWTHYDGQAVVGVLAGTQLESIPSPLMSWDDFRTTYPDGLVLDETKTGFGRDYGRNPYVGYDDPDSFPFLFAGSVDERARAKQRVVGITMNDESVAYTLELVSNSGQGPHATNIEVGGESAVIFWSPGQASVLDDVTIAASFDVGTVGVFIPAVDGEMLTFVATGDGFVDDQTASEWNAGGVALTGPLAGSKLERIRHLDTFWFAWATYEPETTLVES